MKISTLVVLAALCATLGAPAYADWDAAGEAREAAARKAAAAESARQKAEMARATGDAQMKVYRGQLGARAVGKSDAEVKRMYDSDMAGYQKAAKQYEGMTDKQLEAMGRDLQKQYGGK
jgi:hypothetical protein